MSARQRLTMLVVGVVCLGVGLLITRAMAKPEALADAIPSQGAPPMVTHGDYPEEQCIRCHEKAHGAHATSITMTSHPERKLCRQCHVPHRDAPLRVNTTFEK